MNLHDMTEQAYKNGYQKGYESGRKDAVEIPCKIGDVVWGIRNYKGIPTPQLGRVSEIFFVGSEMTLCIVVKSVCRGEWGKQVFATHKEAYAAAVRERRNDGSEG